MIALPVAVGLGYGWLLVEPWGVFGYWTGLTLGLGCVAIMICTRLFGAARAVIRWADPLLHLRVNDIPLLAAQLRVNCILASLADFLGRTFK